MNEIPTPTFNEMQKWATAAGLKLNHETTQLIIWASQWGYGKGCESKPSLPSYEQLNQLRKEKGYSSDEDLLNFAINALETFSN